MPEALLTVDEAAQRLKMHPDTLRRHLRRGEIHAIKRGPRMWRIPESALEAPNIEAPANTKPQAPLYPSPFPGEHQSEVAPLDLGPLSPMPGEVARRLDARKRFDGEQKGEDNAPEARAQVEATAILEGLHSDDAATRNAAIVALSQADEETSRIVEEAAARAVEEWQGEEDDLSDWRALDSEPFHFPEEPADYLTGLYRSDAKAEEAAT